MTTDMKRSTRAIAVATLMSLGSTIAIGQGPVKTVNGGQDTPRDRTVLKGSELTDVMIQNAIATDGPITLNVPRFKRMGDALAVAVNRLNPSPNVLSEGRRIAIVDILKMSFSHPSAITRSKDRIPSATFALLERLDAPGASVRLHDRIIEAKLAIQTSVAALQ